MPMIVRIDTFKKTVSVESDAICSIDELEFLSASYEVIMKDMMEECEWLMAVGELELNARLNIFESGRKLKKIPGNK